MNLAEELRDISSQPWARTAFGNDSWIRISIEASKRLEKDHPHLLRDDVLREMKTKRGKESLMAFIRQRAKSGNTTAIYRVGYVDHAGSMIEAEYYKQYLQEKGLSVEILTRQYQYSNGLEVPKEVVLYITW